MKKMLTVLLVVALTMTLGVFSAVAQNESRGATHADVAALLVQIMGMSSHLPAVPTPHQNFEILAMNGIFPMNGWSEDAVLTQGDLARILVQAMGLEDEVDNPEDPQSWINVLRAAGISLTSVRENFAELELLPETLGANILTETADPLLVRPLGNPVDEPIFGVDMMVVRRVMSELEMSQGEFRPISPTPH